MKTKQLKIGYFRTSKLVDRELVYVDVYRVVSVKNSVTYRPGEELCKAEIQDLCDSTPWEVLVIPYSEKGDRP